MALTVDQTVAAVVGRLRAKLAFVSLSVVADHTNPDVVPAVADACWYVEILPSDYPAVTDADLAPIYDPKVFVDAATLETLYVIRGAFGLVDSQVEQERQNLNQFHAQLEDMIADYQNRVPRPNQPRGAVGTMPTSYPCLPPGPGSPSPYGGWLDYP